MNSAKTIPRCVSTSDKQRHVWHREVQQQTSALQAAQAEVWAERSQLALEQQAVAEDKARAVQHAQEAATAHTKLLAQFKQARMQSVLVSNSFHITVAM